jgi:hypothetical protein
MVISGLSLARVVWSAAAGLKCRHRGTPSACLVPDLIGGESEPVSTVLTESSSRPGCLSCDRHDDLSPASNRPSRIARGAQRL